MNLPSKSNRNFAWRKKLGFSLAAIVIVAFPLVIFETVLRLSWDENSDDLGEISDPYIGFNSQESLFEKDPSGQFYQIRESRLGYFRPAKFHVKKPAKGFRVFVIGGSTVQGRPWETETAFGKWLDLAIQACEPDSKIEVINCGGVSYASYRLSLIVKEIIAYAPDLVILCTGHNEYLESRTYQSESTVSFPVTQVHRLLSLSKTYRWLRHQVLRQRHHTPSRATLDQQVITRLDYENGLNLFTRDSLQRKMVRQHFRFNLESMISMLGSRNIQLLVLAPPCNQKDCFPFKPLDDWEPESVSRFAEMSLEELQSVPESNRTPDYYFFRGTRRLAINDAEAVSDFEVAVDRDICPLRMTSALREILESAVRQGQKLYGDESLFYLDLQSRCQSESTQSIIGDQLLVDHVHPSIQTHQKIATWILDILHRKQLVYKPETWEKSFQQSVKSHLDSLDFGYFQRGKERLSSVLKWSRGQALYPLKQDR